MQTVCRLRPRGGPRVLVEAAEEADSTRQAAFEAGANYYILKPPTLEQLEEGLGVVMSQNPPPSRDGES